MKTITNRIADYLRTCVHDNVGETRAYIDPDNIDLMADEISSIVISGHWISVNDRLPVPCHDVFVTNGTGRCVSYVINGKFRDWPNTATHWMPLPKPPQP